MMSPNLMYLAVLASWVLVFPADCQNYFTQSPINQTADEGSRVRFTCKSEYMTLCRPTHERFFWYRSITYNMQPSDVGSCLGVTNMRGQMTTEFDITKKQFHLVINNVQLHDAGEYWCVYYYGPHRQSSQNSLKASLTVRRPGPPPSCMVTSPSNPRVGDSVSFTCTLAETDPSAAITWYINSSSGHRPLSSIQEVRQGRVSRVNRVLQATDNMKEFVCVAGPDFNTGPRCSVPPLQIPPRVSISPTVLSVHEGDSVVFTCEATPPLVVDEYRWQIYQLDSSEVKVNRDTMDGFHGKFNMTGNTLEILAVSADFHNSTITCTAIYPQGSSKSIYRSLLTVLSVTTMLSPTPSTAAATAQKNLDPSIPKTDETHFGTNIPNQQSTSSSIMATITQHIQKEENDTKTQQLPIGVLVGGVLAILLLLVTIILFVCFLVRNKRKVRRPRQVVAGSPVQESARQDTVTAGTSVETDLTYLNLPRDDQSHPTQPNLLSEETTECETVLYAIPDKTMRGEVKHFTMTPPANKTSTGSGFVSLPRDLEPVSLQDKNRHGSHEMVVYAQVNKNITRHPKATADKPASQDEDTEALDYADLDFNRVQGAAGIDAIYAKPHKGPKK